MKPFAYYNEIDPFAAAWLRELITAKVIADGEIDTRSIVDVQPADLMGFRQCHFFAGIGGWSYALRLAGWPDDRDVWTGSCPCQPFSAAGSQTGGNDPRHLWPTWFRLVRVCRPVVLFGEQVEAAITHGWLDLVSDDLEREGYAIGSAGLPATSVGAFHRRQRLWFVAHAEGGRHRIDGCASRTPGHVDVGGAAGRLADANGGRQQQRDAGVGRLPIVDANGGLGDTVGEGLEGFARDGDGSRQPGRHDAQSRGPISATSTRDLADADGGQSSDGGLQRSGRHGQQPEDAATIDPWACAVWIPCADGKARPIESGLEPLAYGIPARVGRLRGYGNAIVPQVAAAFISAYVEAVNDLV